MWDALQIAARLDNRSVMVRIAGWMLFSCGLVLGCATGGIAAPRWTAYCCEGGTVAEPTGCRPKTDACGESTALAMECRDDTDCTTGAADCYCCREAGQVGCTTVLRSSRTVDRGCPPPDEEEEVPLSPSRRPAAGTVWSPF